jgi:hypothetical protein
MFILKYYDQVALYPLQRLDVSPFLRHENKERQTWKSGQLNSDLCEE